MKILQINASARSAGANSTRLAAAVTARLQAQNPQAGVTFRYTANGPEGLAMGAESASQAFTEVGARIEEIFA